MSSSPRFHENKIPNVFIRSSSSRTDDGEAPPIQASSAEHAANYGSEASPDEVKQQQLQPHSESAAISELQQHARTRTTRWRTIGVGIGTTNDDRDYFEMGHRLGEQKNMLPQNELRTAHETRNHLLGTTTRISQYDSSLRKPQVVYSSRQKPLDVIARQKWGDPSADNSRLLRNSCLSFGSTTTYINSPPRLGSENISTLIAPSRALLQTQQSLPSPPRSTCSFQSLGTTSMHCHSIRFPKHHYGLPLPYIRSAARIRAANLFSNPPSCADGCSEPDDVEAKDEIYSEMDEALTVLRVFLQELPSRKFLLLMVAALAGLWKVAASKRDGSAKFGATVLVVLWCAIPILWHSRFTPRFSQPPSLLQVPGPILPVQSPVVVHSPETESVFESSMPRHLWPSYSHQSSSFGKM